MRISAASIACAILLAASAAAADSRVFIVANQADGYGVDECLASGEKCGAHDLVRLSQLASVPINDAKLLIS